MLTLTAINWRGPEVAAQFRSLAGSAVAAGAEVIRSYAVPLAPIDTGALRASAGVVVDIAALSASVYFDTPYAVRQHEELGYRHPGGGGPKYLERAITEGGPDAYEVMAAIMRRGLR